MTTKPEMNFGDSSVAEGYDKVLVPLFFDQWAQALIDSSDAWSGNTVLDLAAGTGIVTQKLSEVIGGGKVIAADINPEMLELAKKRNSASESNIEYKVSPAEPLDIETDSIDVVVCQQGFQFFPDKPAAAQEIYRVLRNGGSTTISTWCSIEENEFFRRFCESLRKVGADELANKMQVPFNHMPADVLKSAFDSAGFTDVGVEKERRPMSMPGGAKQAVEVLYASPVAPDIRAFSQELQDELIANFVDSLSDYEGTGLAGEMVSNMLTARRL